MKLNIHVYEQIIGSQDFNYREYLTLILLSEIFKKSHIKINIVYRICKEHNPDHVCILSFS